MNTAQNTFVEFKKKKAHNIYDWVDKKEILQRWQTVEETVDQ